ncbi:MAG: carboxypeptidase regulatory-like domain-containing protein [Acidobacteria bacterium]|nr:carboxypeptidase regulatory-like domain-containing protein [Acidobacteriota bacterium]
MKNLIRAAQFILILFITIFVSLSIFEAENTERRTKIDEPDAAVSDNVPAETQNIAELNKKELSEIYGKLPIQFEPNIGQTDDTVKFIARGSGYSLFLKQNEAILSLQRPSTADRKAVSSFVRMRVESANPMPHIEGVGQTESKTNYLIGNDPSKWQTEIPNYSKVKYEQIIPGIDAVYYGNGQQLEYDFVVAPGVDPDQLKLNFDGPKDARIDKRTGDLVFETGAGPIRQMRPIVYQNTENGRSEVASSYELKKIDGEFAVSFRLAEYDRSKELIIDPILAYGTYLGGSVFDEARAITVDPQGNAYVVGTSASLNFPTTAGVLKTTNPPSTNNVQWYDAFVTKLNPSGTALVFSTYFGGRNGSETGSGVAVDAVGNILFSGTTMATDMPLVNAYQTTFGGTDDAFAAKLGPTGSSLIYSTYLGGNNTDTGGRIAFDPTTGDAVFAGFASSPNFPTTPGSYKQKLCDSPATCSGIFYTGSYVVKLSANGNIVYSTLFDAGINDVVLDLNNNATVGGTAAATFPTTAGSYQPVSSGGIEGIIAKLNPAGSAVTFGTFLGGGLQSDRVRGLAIDSAGNIYAAGQTQNTAFPTTAGAFDQTYNGGEDGFVTKLNSTGSSLIYSTFLGGTGKDEPFAIDLAPNNDVFIAGETTGPLTFPLRNSLNGTNGTIFLTRINTDATALVFSTLLGQGGAYDVASDLIGNAYITGHTTSIPVTPGAFQTMKGDAASSSSQKDAYVLKIAPTDESITAYSISGTVSDPTQFGNNQPITVTVTGTVSRSYILPYGSGSGMIPYHFGNLPAGGNYTVSVHKIGFTTLPESVVFTGLGANQFADFTIQPNQAPEGVITSPAHGTTFNAPASITIQATATDPDGDAIAKVEFVAYSSQTGVINLATDTTAPYEFTWTGVPVGTWSLSAIPTDSKGLRGFSTPTVHVFVVDPNPVSVSITSPTSGQALTEGSYVPIAVSVSSSVNLVEVRDQNDQLVGRMTGLPWTTTWRAMNTGNYTLTAKAFNSQGQTANSQPVNISVTPINHRITGKILDSITSAPLAGVTLNLVSPTDPNITATTVTDSTGSYLFTGLGTTPNDGVIITPTRPGYDFNPANRAITYLGYIEWPNQNFSSTAQTGITINLTSPTQGQTYTAPANVSFSAEASSTSGSIAKVEFFRWFPNGDHTLIGTDTTAPYSVDWTNVAAGGYVVFARATEIGGAIAQTGTVSISVNAQPTTIRLQGDITNPGGGWMQGITVRLTGNANGSPVNQTSISNSFGAYGFFNLISGGNYTITPEGVGGMTFTPPSVTVLNATFDQFDIDFEASAANQPPSVQINTPTNGGVFNMPAAIPVNVTTADADGQVVHLTVTAQSSTMSTTIGQSNNGTFNAPWQPTIPGNYTLWATARDNGGLQTSVNIQITVNQPSPVAISGRIVDRGSNGIADVTVEVRDQATENTLIGSASTDAAGNYSIPNIPTFANYVLRARKDGYTFSPQRRVYFNLAASQSNADFTGTLQVQLSDFDGDGGSDLAVWRPSTGVWHVSRSKDNGYTSSQFGGAAFGDVVVPGNYDGDKKIDFAVFRNGVWYIMNSTDGTVRIVSFGLAGDQPAPGDFDGDGKSEIAVFRPSDGNWYMLRSSDGAFDARHFGLNGDVPVAGDFDGDGKTDLAVWRPTEGIWYVMQSTDGNMSSIRFGQIGDLPLVGDFDGDKKTDFAVYRPSSGVWYVMQSSDFGFRFTSWGVATDKPVPGDYDHDGKTDYAVFRPSEGNWYILKSSNGSYNVTHFGSNGDIPIPAAYIR